QRYDLSEQCRRGCHEYPPGQPDLEFRKAAFELQFEAADSRIEARLQCAEFGLEGIDPSVDSGCELREPLPELRVEPREVQVVHLMEIGAIRGVHLVEPIDDGVDDLVAEAFVDGAGKPCCDRHGSFRGSRQSTAYRLLASRHHRSNTGRISKPRRSRWKASRTIRTVRPFPRSPPSTVPPLQQRFQPEPPSLLQ